MKKNINRIVLMIAASVTLFTGCLEKFPDNAVSGRKAITNVDEANQAVIGIYSAFKSSALYSGYLTLLPDIQADLVQAVDGYTNTYGDIWRWDILSTNREIESVYGSLYGIIGQCNYFFDMVSQFEGKLTDDDAISKLDALKGEVYFARALCYSELIKCFCKAYDSKEQAENELGVVIVSSYYNPEPKTRSSLQKSYEFVLKDLEKAAELIDVENVNNSPYFSKSAVNALHARMSLYMHDYETAVKYSTYVIEDDYLGLSRANYASITSGVSDYDYMWQNDNAVEIIWKVGFTTTSMGGAIGRVFFNYDYVSYKPDYVPAEAMLDLYDEEDLRYNAFFRMSRTGYPHGLTCALLYKYYGNPTFRNINVQNMHMPKVFRLSEQYLIRAEAYCRMKRYSLAADDLTTLRKARYSAYGTANVNRDDWEQTILDERVKELFMEGFRLNDLKRFHRGFERKPQDHTVSTANDKKVEADDPLFVWPIPQHELDAPGADIRPNESNR